MNRLLLVAVLLMLAACDTERFIRVYTDMDAGTLRSICVTQTSVDDPTGRPIYDNCQALSLARGTDAYIHVTPQGGDSTRRFRVVVTGCTTTACGADLSVSGGPSATRRAVVRTSAVLGFQDGRALRDWDAFLAFSCVGIPCEEIDPSLTCDPVRGACVTAPGWSPDAGARSDSSRADNDAMDEAASADVFDAGVADRSGDGAGDARESNMQDSFTGEPSDASNADHEASTMPTAPAPYKGVCPRRWPSPIIDAGSRIDAESDSELTLATGGPYPNAGCESFPDGLLEELRRNRLLPSVDAGTIMFLDGSL